MKSIVIIEAVNGFVVKQDNKLIIMPGLGKVHSFLDGVFGAPLLTPEEFIKRQHPMHDIFKKPT